MTSVPRWAAESNLCFLTYEFEGTFIKKEGCKYGSKIDEMEKTHPSLVPWDNLPVDEKSNTIEDIKAWPKILANSNF